MNENGKNKREWVKTAAIIFLSVMLVLTFFSQTIMNYSLPEVATQYVQSGTITAKIRGTGVVESGDPYEIKMTESRKVSGVAVRVGDQVQKGDVLLYLEDSESEELKAAREELESAREDYDKALLDDKVTSSDIYSANKDVSAATYRQQITNAQAAVKTAEDNAAPLNKKVMELDQLIEDIAAQITYEQSQDTYAAQRETTAEAALKTATENQQAAQTARDTAQTEVNRITVQRDTLSAQIQAGSVSDSDAAGRELEELQKQLDAATKTLNERQTALNNANTALDNANKEYNEAKKNNTNRMNSQTITNLQSQQSVYVLQRYGANKELEVANEVLQEKKDELTELISKIGNVRIIESLLDEINKKQEKVNELAAKAVNATVTADIAGTVTAINVTAGNTTSAETPVVVLQPEGKGFTMSFSVTNEQAKRLSVGDKADLVNAWRYDDVEVTLASIKPDKNNPGQNKMLTFDVTGEVTAGQTLNVSVGQRSANFDLIVPNSAIREDSNGKFILIVESKSSPLGNRYIATRVDVEVLASDDTQSAISGGLYGYEYVITTSTKPVEAGKQVRLADN